MEPRKKKLKPWQEVVQFLRGYWTLTAEEHRRIGVAALLITIMQILAVVEPAIVTAMIQDALHLGIRAKTIIIVKLVIAFSLLMVQGGLQWSKARMVRDIAVVLEHRLTSKFLDRLFRLGGIFHETHNVGQLQGTVARGVAKVREITFLLAQEFIPLIVTLMSTLVAVIWYSWASAIVILISFALFLLLTVYTRGSKMRDRQERQELRRTIDKFFGNIVACVRTVWIFRQEEYELKRLKELQDKLHAMIDDEHVLYDRADFFRGMIIGFGRIGVVVVCLFETFRDPRAIANLFLVVMLAERLFRLSYNIGGIIDRYVESMNPIQDMMDILAAEILIKDPDHPIALQAIKRDVAFRGALYTYPSRPDQRVLNGVDLTIAAGKKTAIVGGSGGGKSTIVKALMRFIDLDEGDLLLDGISIKNLTLAVLRGLVGCVSQDVEIFDGTVAMNIAYGRPEAIQAEIEQAARFANIHDQIMGFADGYQTKVGNEGQQLSGGQRQRIAIARVLLANPDVIIFDEATSAVDPESDVAIHEAVERLSKLGKTIVIIAHRLGTVRGSDRIYCLDKGQVVENGTHEQLIARRGRYHALWIAHERGSHGNHASGQAN